MHCSDRAGAEGLYRNLRILAHEKAGDEAEIPVLKTIATTGEGVGDLAAQIDQYLISQNALPDKRVHLLTEKCWQLIQARRMRGISHSALRSDVAAAINKGDFNLYSFSKNYLSK
jgi:LAO/AO transport system kinase